MSDLTALRAEVERLRDDFLKQADVRSSAGYGSSTILDCYATAYSTVLDLIDKHTREGQ